MQRPIFPKKWKTRVEAMCPQTYSTLHNWTRQAQGGLEKSPPGKFLGAALILPYLHISPTENIFPLGSYLAPYSTLPGYRPGTRCNLNHCSLVPTTVTALDSAIIHQALHLTVIHSVNNLLNLLLSFPHFAYPLHTFIPFYMVLVKFQGKFFIKQFANHPTQH